MSDIRRIGKCPGCGFEGPTHDPAWLDTAFRYKCGKCEEILPDMAVRLA